MASSHDDDTDFETFCTSVMRALAYEAPDLVDFVRPEAVEEWVGKRWPLPRAAMLSTPLWARAYVAQCLAS